MTKILVVEDNKIDLLIIMKLIKSLGCEVDTAENGKICLTKIDKMKYNMIFMDIHMPVMNGLDAAKEIRIRGAKTPIIALTSDTFEGVKKHCLEIGMNDFLAKPVDKGRLESLISKYRYL